MDKNIDTIFSRRKARLINIEREKHYVLAIPIIETESGLQILFEIRGNISQPGDVCLPGGGVDSGESLERAVIREMSEELLISPDRVRIIGQSDYFISDWGRVIHPFVVKLHDYEYTFSAGEVADVFTMPVEYFLTHEPKAYELAVKEIPGDDFPFDRISGGKNYSWHDGKRYVYFYDYEEHTIWGLTAKVMKSFAGILRDAED